MKKPRTLWAFDCETDPFLHGRVPVPFAWGALSENGDYWYAWGEDSTKKFIKFLLEQDNALFLGHNAGKFDTLFLKEAIFGNILMVDGRIIKCKIGNCEIRDSFAILPMALKKLGAKSEIDYKKLERAIRDIHKAEILRYLKQDCVVLLESVQNFYTKAGKRRLTIASQASFELRALYPDLPKLNAEHDAAFRPFFYGGRVQAFEKGIIPGNFKLYDVNGMYPDRMAKCQHPFGASYKAFSFSEKRLPDNNCGFFQGTCDSQGVFPVRQKNRTTPYSIGRVEIAVTLHEIRAALECGLVKNLSGIILLPEQHTDFSKFILPHYERRLKAKACNDESGMIYHKIIPNSSYGRFAMSPENRYEYFYTEQGEAIRPYLDMGWGVAEIDLEDERYILKKPVSRPWQFFEDVATGASITGAARAKLMYALHRSERPLYCDTDSILCETLHDKIGNGLGDWKEELECDVAAIAGKKTYVLLKNKRPIKQACKGVNACPTEIYQAADGDEVEIVRHAPTMRLGKISFNNRIIRKT